MGVKTSEHAWPKFPFQLSSNKKVIFNIEMIIGEAPKFSSDIVL